MLFLLACEQETEDSTPEATDPTDSVPTAETDSASSVEVVGTVEVSVHEEIGAILVVSWAQGVAGESWVEYGLDGEESQQTPAVSREAGTHTQLVVGVPYDSVVELRVQVDPGDGAVSSEAVSAQTDPLPDTVPAPVLQVADESAWGADERWLLIGMSSGGDGWEAEGFWKMILDRKGRVVWAHETPGGYRTFYMQPARDGDHLVWDECTFWTDFDEGEGSLAHRMTLDGTVLETVEVPGLHHAFLDLGDGALAWGGYEDDREILRERAADGSVREIWDCTAWWAESGARMPCDGNALFWDPATDHFLFSSDNENSIAEVDRTSGEVLRAFGQLDPAWDFADGTDPFWKQHGPNWTESGTLLLSSWTSEFDHQVIAREYEIDEEEQVVREIWRCGEGIGTTGEYGGEAHRLSNGNTLLNYGEGGNIREFTPECEVVWHLEWPYANLLGRAVFLSDLYAFLP